MTTVKPSVARVESTGCLASIAYLLLRWARVGPGLEPVGQSPKRLRSTPSPERMQRILAGSSSDGHSPIMPVEVHVSNLPSLRFAGRVLKKLAVQVCRRRLCRRMAFSSGFFGDRVASYKGQTSQWHPLEAPRPVQEHVHHGEGITKTFRNSSVVMGGVAGANLSERA